MSMLSRLLFTALSALLLAAPAAALEPVPWGEKDHLAQFRFFTEAGTYTREAWEGLSPEDQEAALREAREPALKRQEEMQAYYQGAAKLWELPEARDYAAGYDPDGTRSVRIWLGQAKAAALEKKLLLVRDLLAKADRTGLTEAEAAALRPYLARAAIDELPSARQTEALARQAEVSGKRYEVPKEAISGTVGGVSRAMGDYTGKSVARVFDGSTARSELADPVRAGTPRPGIANSVAAPVSGQVGTYVAENARAALNAPAQRTTNAATIKSAAPAPVTGGAAKPAGSTAWTSDAYGFTITTSDGRTQTFRDQRQAEAAIRALPAGSVSKVIFYGHGSPGMQTVGNATYEPDNTADLLKGKMARGGVVQFSGCNTASIGDATLNPAVGLSMLTRRVMYFSIPYIQDRLSGRSAEESKKMWEQTWNADLSRDTSLKMRGSIVCGYRTFGLVPGRLPGLTRVMGNQEATTPGYVAGKKVCYQDGREVPEP